MKRLGVKTSGEFLQKARLLGLATESPMNPEPM
jgi:hypothetical protein